MFWIILIIIAGALLWKWFEYYYGDIDHTNINTMLPDEEGMAKARAKHLSSLHSQLQLLGVVDSPRAHTFTLPHMRMPLTISISSTANYATLGVTGELPASSALLGMELQAGYHTGIQTGAPSQTLALFELGGTRDEMFAERSTFRLAQCKLSASGALELAVQLNKAHEVEAVCAWLNSLQDDLSCEQDEWLSVMRRRTRSASTPTRSEQAMEYIYTWYPSQIEQMLEHADQLDDWAHVKLLAHVYTDAPLSTHALHHITELITAGHVPDELKVRAMNICLHAPRSEFDHQIFSEVTLAMLQRGVELDEAWITLTTMVHHDHPSSYYTQSDAIMAALCEKRPDDIPALLDPWLDASWSHITSRQELADYATHHLDAHTELGLLGTGVLCWTDLSSVTPLTRRYMMRPMLTHSRYLVWERLILYRADELAADRAFLDEIASHISKRRQHHDSLTRLLVIDLGHSPHMPALLARIMPSTTPYTAEGWTRCAALVTEHLVDREDLIDMMLELIPMCPSDGTARRIAAQLPGQDPRVQDFLIAWPLTARSARHQLITTLSETDAPLSSARTRALVNLLADKKHGPSYASTVLPALEQKGDIQGIKRLHELRQLPHTRPFHKELDAAIEELKKRFAAQGGELSLSSDNARQGALTLEGPRS